MKVGKNMTAWAAIRTMSDAEFTELQYRCEFNRIDPAWKSLGCRLADLKRRRHTVIAKLVPKPA